MKPARRRKPKNRDAVVFTPALAASSVPRGSVLAVGIDVAWWGGSAGKRSRRKSGGAFVVGKAYDDAIDSVLSLLCATALADGCAHVHIGDPADGHIVGPGLP